MASAVADTPLGTFGVEASASGVRRVRLPADGSTPEHDGSGEAIARLAAAQLGEYARGEREEFELPIDLRSVTQEHRRVLESLLEIAPYGHTVTYGELGVRSGVEDPRDVGVHMNRNPLPIIVPCHRVVASDGLGGYGGGLALKRRLLELEGALPTSFDLGDV